VVGGSPKHYLTRTRIATPPPCCTRPTGRWAEIALQIGYGSEFSIAKAFKRTFGIPSGTYRGQLHGVPGLGGDPDAAILTQDDSGSLSARFGHPS
jgi:transcriptional regulator GlxA family with amidase domain